MRSPEGRKKNHNAKKQSEKKDIFSFYSIKRVFFEKIFFFIVLMIILHYLFSVFISPNVFLVQINEVFFFERISPNKFLRQLSTQVIYMMDLLRRRSTEC